MKKYSRLSSASAVIGSLRFKTRCCQSHEQNTGTNIIDKTFMDYGIQTELKDVLGGKGNKTVTC